jgi:protein O-mannosyl-transferase
MSRTRLIALLLALVTLAVYLPVVSHGFILYDDGDYVTENKIVQDGLTLSGIHWAFTTYHSANWHPLTWLSHMTDCELFGPSAAGPHFINALLHVANTLLVFALWLRLTARGADAKSETEASESDAIWSAALLAALFALHPLHVESVAWISERKDVLSTFFGFLALLCYVHYAKAGGRRWPHSYWLTLIFFACGLMSKPMLVTWPFVMLLLDYWPLRRLNMTNLRQLLLEKVPFFALTAISCVITYKAQSIGAVKSLAAVPLVYRLENTPVGIATYLLKMVWPTKLAIIYPMPDAIAPVALIVSLAVLLFITIVAWQTRKESPFLLVGWLWFLGTLVPVLGLVKVGDAAIADRYTYIPSVGIFMAVAFGVQKYSKRFALPKFLLPAMAIIVLGALVMVTERQLQFWRDDESLFSHAIRVTAKNADAYINYGVALENDGKPVEAIAQYQQAVKYAPTSYMARADLGNLLYYTGKPEEAVEQYEQAVQANPNMRVLRDGLGTVLASLGRYAEATNEFYAAMLLDPGSAAPHFYLGIALAAQNDFTAATNEFAEAVRLDPSDPSTLVEWSKVLLQQRQDAEALDKLHQALQLDPNNFQTLTFAARVLASDERPGIRDGATALAFAQKASAITSGSQPVVEDTLAMAYAESGQFDKAQETVSHAISLATADGMKAETITAMQERQALYQKHQPWRESCIVCKGTVKLGQ